MPRRVVGDPRRGARPARGGDPMSRPPQWNLTSPVYKPSENEVETACLTLLQYRNYKPFRLHAGKFRSWDYGRVITGVPKGTPDYAVEHEFYPGFLLETKGARGDISPEQVLRIGELRQGWG